MALLLPPPHQYLQQMGDQVAQDPALLIGPLLETHMKLPVSCEAKTLRPSQQLAFARLP